MIFSFTNGFNVNTSKDLASWNAKNWMANIRRSNYLVNG